MSVKSKIISFVLSFVLGTVLSVLITADFEVAGAGALVSLFVAAPLLLIELIWPRSGRLELLARLAYIGFLAAILVMAVICFLGWIMPFPGEGGVLWLWLAILLFAQLIVKLAYLWLVARMSRR